MSVSIDELLQRLEDDSATFDALEVRALMDWKCKQTARNAISSATIEAVMQNSNRIVEHDREMWQLLFSQISHDIHPVLEDVSADEQE